MKTNRRAALGFVFVTVLLDMLAFGIIAPVLPRLILDFLNDDMARTSEAMGLFVTNLGGDAVLLFAGAGDVLSDRYAGGVRGLVILLS